jgi:hypothetical protein
MTLLATDTPETAKRKKRKAVTPRQRAADARVYGKTKIANGSEFFPGVDGRSLVARRARELSDLYLKQLGGKVDDLTMGVVRQLVQVTVRAEQLGACMASGEQVNVIEICTLASTALRLSLRLGLKPANLVPIEDEDYDDKIKRMATPSAIESEPAA